MKVGDIIICIDDLTIPFGYGRLYLDGEYTIMEFNRNEDGVLVKDNTTNTFVSERYYNINRFKLKNNRKSKIENFYK